MENIKKLDIQHNKSHYLSIIYLGLFYYLSLNAPLWENNVNIALPLFISSTGILFLLYFENKETLNAVFNNGIIKWAFTVLIYSACLWFVKLKLNITYGISIENINYSAYVYAFFLTVPAGALIAGILAYVYIFTREMSLVKLVVSALISVLIANPVIQALHLDNNVERLILIALTIFMPYNLLNFLTFSTTKKRAFDAQKVLTGASSLAVFVALFFIGFNTMRYVENFQEIFLFLDAHASTTCAKSDNGDLYIIKNETQCYKITGTKLSHMTLSLVNRESSGQHEEEAHQ
ncbi:hypothetical protein AAF463_24420 (plasmid) [Pantoea sp. BJ2]|uniref:Uncharacterized protein n=1 Tax=Pantoea sp. BJ2 TaxID=3141322 RepID=A0AAU7U2T0_9GAMM